LLCRSGNEVSIGHGLRFDNPQSQKNLGDCFTGFVGSSQRYTPRQFSCRVDDFFALTLSRFIFPLRVAYRRAVSPVGYIYRSTTAVYNCRVQFLHGQDIPCTFFVLCDPHRVRLSPVFVHGGEC
jgi:hypothetical protein